MSKPAAHEDKGAVHGDKKTTDGKEGNDSASPSKAELIRAKLKIVTHYLALGFAPIVSAIALALAVAAIVGNKSVSTELSQGAPKFESMNTAISASRGELEKLKAAMAEQKSQQDEAFNKLNGERENLNAEIVKIVQSLSKLQVKLKISPTLEEQLRQAASAPVVATTPPASAVTAPVQPAAVATAPPPKPVEKKFSPQVESMKKAIEQYNKQ